MSVTQYTWDIGVEAGLPLLLQDNAASYIYGPGGMLLEEVVGTSSTNVYYYHGDRLGSVRALTSSTGAVSNTYTYDAYGKTLTSTGSVYNPFKYTGEYTDAESGFVYLRARYYDPESQQFLTVDPALAWTEQAYAYVGGSPTNFGDPSGLDWLGDWLGKAKRQLCENTGLFCDGMSVRPVESTANYNPFGGVADEFCSAVSEGIRDPYLLAGLYGADVRFEGESLGPIKIPKLWKLTRGGHRR